MLNHNFDKQFRLQKRYKATSKKKKKKKKILNLFLKETFRDRKLVDYIRMS